MGHIPRVLPTQFAVWQPEQILTARLTTSPCRPLRMWDIWLRVYHPRLRRFLKHTPPRGGLSGTRLLEVFVLTIKNYLVLSNGLSSLAIHAPLSGSLHPQSKEDGNILQRDGGFTGRKVEVWVSWLHRSTSAATKTQMVPDGTPHLVQH